MVLAECHVTVRLESRIICLLLRLGDTANEQVVFFADGGPDEKCNIMISALKLVTNFIKK